MESTARGRRVPLRERARAAVPIAATFGGYFAAIIALRLLGGMVAGGAFPSGGDLGEMVAVIALGFTGFAGLAFMVKLAGVPIFSRDE